MITALVLSVAGAVLKLAPAHAREALLGDLLEEHAGRARSPLGPAASWWLARECARSAVPLALWRMRRAGPTRVALALAAGLCAAAATHAASDAAWHAVFARMPLCALYAVSPPWRVVTSLLEINTALIGAVFIVKSGTARKGGRT